MSTKCQECGGAMKGKKITHRYTECGLDNVSLEGVSEFTCTKCDNSFVDVPEPMQLHIVLAIALSSKKGMLIGPEIRFLRREIGMTGKAFAEFIGVDPVTLSRWENNVGSANKSESNDRLIRLAFRGMMCERLKAMISFLEGQIQKSGVISYHRKRVAIHADAMKYISIPTMNSSAPSVEGV